MPYGIHTVDSDYFPIPTLRINWTKTLKLNSPTENLGAFSFTYPFYYICVYSLL